MKPTSKQTSVTLRSVSRSFRAWGARAKVNRPLHDGEELRLGRRTLEVQHRPGHSPSDTLFWDADRRILIAADHLIAHISSNPLISRPLDGADERPRALMTYIESLRRTRELRLSQAASEPCAPDFMAYLLQFHGVLVCFNVKYI